MLDRLPVDRIVQMSVRIDVGRPQGPGHRRRIGRRIRQLEPGRHSPPAGRLRRRPRSPRSWPVAGRDPGGSTRCRPPPARPRRRSATSAARPRLRRGRCTRSRAPLRGPAETARGRRSGFAARTTDATVFPSRSPGRRRSRRPEAAWPARPAGRGRAGRRRRAPHAGGRRTSARATGTGIAGSSTPASLSGELRCGWGGASGSGESATPDAGGRVATCTRPAARTVNLRSVPSSA